MVRKKKYYKVKRVDQGPHVAGIKVVMQQKTLMKSYLWGLIKRYKKRDIVLWLPEKGRFYNVSVKKGSWLILKEDFNEFEPDAIKVYGACHSSKILKKLSNLTKDNN
jgi:hypothetical protein